jgi:diphthamide synthase (EF-2-diphthine--ammonia ligase)
MNAPHTRTPVVVSWSGGKDSMLMLEALLEDPEYEVVALLTTVSSAYDRVSMHGGVAPCCL